LKFFIRILLFSCLIFSSLFAQDTSENKAPSNQAPEQAIPRSPKKQATASDKLETTLQGFKASLDRFSKVFEEGKGKNIDEIVKLLKEQMNWNQVQEKMFSGKNKNLKGEKPLKANGMEELLNVSLSSFRLMNPRELEQVVLEHTAGGPLHSILSKDYKSLSYVVKLMQDPKALPFFGRMVDQKNKFYIFLGFMLLSFIILYIYKKKRFANQSFFSTLIPRFFLFLGVVFCRLLVFIAIFYKELSPFFEVTNSHFS